MNIRLFTLPSASFYAIDHYDEKIYSFFSAREQELTIEHNLIDSDTFYENKCEYCTNHCDEEEYIEKEVAYGNGSVEIEEELNEEYCAGGYDVVTDGNCPYYDYKSIKKEIVIKKELLPYAFAFSCKNFNFYLTLVKVDETTEDLKIECLPYKIGNVYDSGSICWGYSGPRDFLNIKEAHNLFWSLPFNADLTEADNDEAEEWIVNHSIELQEECCGIEWEELAQSTLEIVDSPGIVGVTMLKSLYKKTERKEGLDCYAWPENLKEFEFHNTVWGFVKEVSGRNTVIIKGTYYGLEKDLEFKLTDLHDIMSAAQISTL